MNTYTITGHLGQDATVENNKGYFMLKFSVAVTRPKKVNEQWEYPVEWHPCVMFGKEESLKNRLPKMTKGAGVVVEGIPQATSYINNNGELVQQLSVNVKVLHAYPVAKAQTQPAQPQPTPLAPLADDDDGFVF